jgi:hypothetical protein
MIFVQKIFQYWTPTLQETLEVSIMSTTVLMLYDEITAV